MQGEPPDIKQEIEPFIPPPAEVRLGGKEDFDYLGMAQEILDNSAYDPNPPLEQDVVDILTAAIVLKDEGLFGTEIYEIEGDAFAKGGAWGVTVGGYVIPLKDIEYMAKVYQIPEGIAMEEIPSFRIEASNKVLLKETLPTALTILVVGSILLSLISTISKKRKENKKKRKQPIVQAVGETETVVADVVVGKPKKKKKKGKVKTEEEIMEDQITALPPEKRREFDRLVAEEMATRRMAPTFAILGELKKTRRRLEGLYRPPGMSQADWELHVMATLSGFYD